MDLNNKIWKELEGGYKIPYDASVPLRELELNSNSNDIGKIWKELWNELHHQGDVGLASYLAIPHIVRICRDKNLFDWNLLGLCSVIDQQRRLFGNPSLPDRYLDYYTKGLRNLQEYIIVKLQEELDDQTHSLALSALATISGNAKMGKAILELSSKEVLDEFLERY